MFVILIFPKKETLQLNYNLISINTGLVIIIIRYIMNRFHHSAMGTWNVVTDLETDQMV